MSEIRVLLAEDHTIVRQGLHSLLDSEADIEVIGEAEDGRHAAAKVEELIPDVVLKDISMPSLNGLKAARQIKQQFPDVKVLVLTMHANEEYVFLILRAGVSGYVVKKAAPTEFVSAIETVHRGDSFLCPSVARTVIEEYIQPAEAMLRPDSFERLTPREREVLQLVAEGCSNREIYEKLCVSVKTVEIHRANLLD